MVSVQTYKHISQKRTSGTAVRCFQVQLFQNPKEIVVLRNVRGCSCLTAICYRNIPAFHILEEDLIFRKISQKRFIIITMNCRNIHALNFSAAAEKSSIAILYFLLPNRRYQFLLFCKISMNATVEFDNIVIFKDMT